MRYNVYWKPVFFSRIRENVLASVVGVKAGKNREIHRGRSFGDYEKF